VKVKSAISRNLTPFSLVVDSQRFARTLNIHMPSSSIPSETLLHIYQNRLSHLLEEW